jgi:hypothetical protein
MLIVAVTKGMRYFYLPLSLTILQEPFVDTSSLINNQELDEIENFAPDFTESLSKFEFNINPEGDETDFYNELSFEDVNNDTFSVTMTN